MTAIHRLSTKGRTTETKRPAVVTRREFLSLLGIGGAVTVLPSALTRSPAEARAVKPVVRRATVGGTTVPVAQGRAAAGPRALVVIELQGGNDGFSMLVPSGDGRFRPLRDHVWLNPKDMLRIDDRYSMAAGLGPVASQLAFVEGVGVTNPDFSHSAMLTRWWHGDPDGAGNIYTGFLGRCCDHFNGTAAIIGASIGGGSTPALNSVQAATVALPDLDSLHALTKDDDARMRPTFSALTDGGNDVGGLETADPGLMAASRAGLSAGLNLVGGLGGLSGKTGGYPQNSRLGSSLSLVGELLGLNSGIRVFHVPWGSFDTHTGQAWSHPDQMRQLGVALSAFRADLTRRGLADRVLVATTSEFGRRPGANANGTDHGTASTALLLGPVRPGRHGAPVDFNQLDRTGNVAATVSMTDYYASLAQWLGIPPAEVLGGSGSPLASLAIAADA